MQGIYSFLKGYHENHKNINPKNTQKQDRRNEFQSGGTMEQWNVWLATVIEQQENFLCSRRSRMAKTVTFCWNSFFPLLPFFLFATQKSVGGGGGMATRPFSLVLPAPQKCLKKDHLFLKKNYKVKLYNCGV